MMADYVDDCIAALRRAKSDTEIFAALLLITKVVKAQDCDRESRRQIFNAVGFEFVDRLLVNDEVPDGCPPYIYKAIALTLLSCFCTEPELSSHPEMLRKANDLAGFVLNSGQSMDEEMMVADALFCLESICCSDVGMFALVEQGVAIKLCQAIAENKFDSCNKALNVVLKIGSSVGSECWKDHPEMFHLIVNKFAADFVSDDTLNKFELCQKLATLVNTLPPNLTEQPYDSMSWYKDIRKGLCDILFSKVTVACLEPALKLSSIMIEKLGTRWALGKSYEDHKFFLIYVHMACIEIRMILEERAWEQVLEDLGLLVSCFVSLETVIAFLVANDQTTMELDASQRQQLYTAVTGAMNVVLTFVSHESRLVDSMDELVESKKHLMIVCVRVIGAWLAEETSALREDVYEMIPFLLKAVAYTCDKVTSGKDETDVMRFLLPGICHLTAEDKARNLLTGLNFQRLLFDYVGHVWKGFVNCATNPRDEEANRYEATLTTSCSVLMNVVVLDSELVTKDPIFLELLHFIFRALPELKHNPKHLILSGNLSVLGLLLLRHYASTVKSCESAMYKYLTSSIKFLWDAHNIEDSRDFNSVVIAQEYKKVWEDIMELWFLGMQALATLLKEITWIGQYILESGWTTVIIQTLRKIPRGAIDASTKSAYEHFLCCLVSSAKCIQRDVKSEGALEVCGIHDMKELEVMLNQEDK